MSAGSTLLLSVESRMKSRLKLLFVLLMIAAALGLYWSSFSFQPFFDDKGYFERGGLDQIFLNGFAFELRWLPYFTTAWIDLIFEDRIFAQRIVNLMLHFAVAFVLYSVVRQVSNQAAPHPNNERAALAAAALFLLHPLAVYAVGYMVQRTILMATLFGLLTLSTYFDGLVTRKKAYFVFAAFFYLLSAFSKEHAVLIPAVALALTPLAVPITPQIWRRLWLPVALFASVAMQVVVKSSAALGKAYEPFAGALTQQLAIEGQSGIWWLSVMTQASLFFKYLGLMLVPNPDWMSIDMRVPFATSVWEIKYLLGGFAFLLYGGISMRWLLKGGRVGLMGFALLAPWLHFIVEFSAVRIQEPFVLYRSYLWLAPLFFLIPSISNSLGSKAFIGGGVLVALLFAFASHDRLSSFSTEYALWDDAVSKLPSGKILGAARVYSNRGYASYERGNLNSALDDFSHALRIDSKFSDAYKNRAFIYMKQRKYSAALRDANSRIQLDPTMPNSYMSRGIIYLNTDDWTLALKDFALACKLREKAGCIAFEWAWAKQKSALTSRK